MVLRDMEAIFSCVGGNSSWHDPYPHSHRGRKEKKVKSTMGWGGVLSPPQRIVLLSAITTCLVLFPPLNRVRLNGTLIDISSSATVGNENMLKVVR